MKSSEIRSHFIDFFLKQNHTHLPSSSLIPGDDPTLLFTNAGMVQFKSIFLGTHEPSSKRVVTVQKCLRAGGKHNDLENVGRTARHHTFFEMLGNFSFGDYFKEEAILWAWKFLTERIGLPSERLWVSVYEKDEEALMLWHEKAGVSIERIVRLGEKDNFWQMGETGPCGPCSEILIDQGPEVGCKKENCAVGCDCDRYLELWNLVFMQYNKDSKGLLSPLPKPSIDTGMGLERLSAVMQGKHDNFDSDLFTPIIRRVEELCHKTFGRKKSTDISIKVLADHIRAAAFAMSDGLVPSNEGRGYVLRRIIRRAARHGFMLGIEEPFLYEIVDTVVEMMGEVYKELKEGAAHSKKVLESEEKRFIQTLSHGLSILDDLVIRLKASRLNIIPGDELFKLYDTYGFPVDLVQDIADEKGLSLDYNGFEKEMKEQKEKARASWTGMDPNEKGIYGELLKQYGHTEFSGYESNEAHASLLAIVKNSSLINRVNRGEQVEMVFDKTPCYGEAGGQVGDQGIAVGPGVKIEIKDTKRHNGLFSHSALVKEGPLDVNMMLKITVDKERREAIKRNHTATHLLHATLKLVLGDHVKQAGSLVAPERLRFDFTHFDALTDEVIQEIEGIVNEKVIANLPVEVFITDREEAFSSGVIALFGEKYGEKVRVVRTGDFSAELCGGTHCKATGEIGPFKIISESSVAAGIRRIEAITGFYGLHYFMNAVKTINKVTKTLKVETNLIEEKIKGLLNEIKTLQKDMERMKDKAASASIEQILDQAVLVRDVKVITKRMDGIDMKTLRNTADKLKERIRSGVLVLASVVDKKAFYVAAVTKDHTNRLKAGDILKKVTQGKGGGRADMAQGGSNDIDHVDQALESVSLLVEKSYDNSN